MSIRFELVSNARPGAMLPRRADAGSAGYDFYIPEDATIMPGEIKLLFTDVKAYMPPDIVLLLMIRSSLAKRGLMLANTPGVVDSSYVDNPSNEGNIGLLLYNTGQSPVTLRAGDRVAQGIFIKYYTTVEDATEGYVRYGGFGSSGR